MANASILAAFERMWHHIQLALSNKVEKNTRTDAWVGVSELHIDDEEGNGAYITPENGDGTLIFYGSGGDQAVRLQNIATPIGNTDAANKGYIDNKFNNQAETWTFTLADGSTVTKKVVLG